MDPADIYAAARAGDFTQFGYTIEALSPQTSPAARAWRIALLARLRLVDARIPSSLPAIRSFQASSAKCRRILAFACLDEALRAVVTLDEPALEQAHQGLGALSSGVSEDAVFFMDSQRFVDGWLRYLAGGSAPDPTSVNPVSRALYPELHVLQIAQDALFALSAGEVQSSIRKARLASRMARSDEMLSAEYLANLVLARVRRYTGTPHLSARILSALGKVVPPTWCGIVGWELVFAGADDGARQVLAKASAHNKAARLARAALSALSDMSDPSNQTRVQTQFAFLRKAGTAASVRRDVEALAVGLGRQAATAPELRCWTAGASEVVPAALSGLCIPDIDDDGNELAGAFVQHGPSGTSRVLRPAVPASQLTGFSRVHVRTNTALCILAFAGPPGLSSASLFSAVYGFDYLPAKHGAVLRQLVQRMRGEVGERGSIEHMDASYRWLAEQVFLIPDPRCAPAQSELILRYLASRSGRGSARDVAAALGIALRTVQQALKHLVEDGACEVVREGRTVQYSLEDTTFSNPTLTRMRPKGVE